MVAVVKLIQRERDVYKPRNGQKAPSNERFSQHLVDYRWPRAEATHQTRRTLPSRCHQVGLHTEEETSPEMQVLHDLSTLCALLLLCAATNLPEFTRETEQSELPCPDSQKSVYPFTIHVPDQSSFPLTSHPCGPEDYWELTSQTDLWRVYIYTLVAISWVLEWNSYKDLSSLRTNALS